MKYILLICMLLGLMGCGFRDGLHYYINAPSGINVVTRVQDVYVDKDFGSADKVAIQEGIEQWNYAFNKQIEIRVVSWDFKMEPSVLKDKNAWFILKIDSSSKLKPPETKEKPTLAFADKIGGHYIYIIRDRISNDDVKGISMHELGHLLGSEHVGMHLMHDTYVRGKYPCVDYASVESVAKAQHLEVAGLNYCIFDN